jgi:hypothetical protein
MARKKNSEHDEPMLTKARKPKKKDGLLQVKTNAQEREAMQLKADRYTNGNLSEWVRYSSICLEPRPEHLAEMEEGA